MSDLSKAKKKLSECLGEGMELYLQNLKSWFKQKISKEEFDFEARRMLPVDAASLHNEFLLALFMKCQHTPVHKDLTSVVIKKTEVKPAKISQSSRGNFQQRFSAVNPLSYAPQAVLRSAEDDTAPSFCSRDMSLPDSLLTHGRMFVTAWENGLEDVDDQTVALVIKAVEYHLKDILTTVLTARNSYKVREARFRYSVGTPAPNPYLRHSAMLLDYTQHSEATSVSAQGAHMASVRPCPELGEEEAVRRLACSTHPPKPSTPVSLFELLASLQLYKNAIPSHTIYATNLERIIHNLWHPSNEDLRQERLHRHRQRTKQSHTPMRVA